jgi:membrane protein
MTALVRAVWREWKRDNASLLAGAVAFYAAFSVGPLLLIIVSAARTLVDDDWALAQILGAVGQFVNPRTATAVERLVRSDEGSDDITITIISGTLLLLGSSAVFRHLRIALDLILDARPVEERKWLRAIRARAFAVLMVIATLFILLSSVALTAVLAAVRGWTEHIVVWRVIDLITTTIVIAALFGAILRFVPHARVSWRNIWPGVVVAAVLFSSGRYVLGLYVGTANVTSIYGAAASLFVVLIAVWFAVITLFIGAELTKISARRT